MELRERLYFRRYEAMLEAAKDCRKRELMMMNFSIIIFGTFIWFIFSQMDNTLHAFFALFVLYVLLGAIGLYIAKLNRVERLHQAMEKKVYDSNNLSPSPFAEPKDLNKQIVAFIYCFIILVTFVLSLTIVGKYLFTYFCGLVVFYIVVFLLSYCFYVRFFGYLISPDIVEKSAEQNFLT